MKIKITQYGYSNDKNGDSLTRAHLGVQDIELEQGVSCALTDSAKSALGAHVGDWVRIDFGGGEVAFRRVDDRAPENERRVDMYAVEGFHKSQHDFADVTLSPAPPGAPLQHHIHTHARIHHHH
jgi:hypothetical protein